MDKSGRSGRRRVAGRHAATHARSGHGHRAIRRRGVRHRRRTRGRGLLAGAIALAGAAALLGVNQVVGGAPTATSAERPTAADGPRTAAERGSGSSPPGRSGAGASATAEAGAQVSSREVRTPAPPRTTGGAAGPEAGAASPEPAERGLVAGTGDPGDPGDVGGGVAGDPAPGGTAGHRADGPSRHTDREAAEFFRTRWGADDKAQKRLKDIRTVGGYLRIYTDLPQSAQNSATALTLCKRGLAYLRARGVGRPVVFVQAEFGENGNPVLANILGPSDTSCRITYPAPG
ncbi:hypothetical protein E1295_16800 [Nonomuraea mesophila]|uniref:Uncharacterized protein n=1 Tax=Nonomuraea mesophila TaxID=2530382 RepID=A0A4R5FLK2_9ACTN|nr:hypothetical protein [Nonomuraea mesophila]TDE53542.1 hypothetical protein E1295_16800 [Nonomuraea mesophila]